MSDRIKIGSGGSFPAVTANQSDMVFWYHDDTETHFPIPRCENLKVAAGAVTPAYQPIPQPKLPQTITYVCALHPGESGKLTIDNDPGGPPQAAGPAGSSKTIDIGPGGTFAEVDVLQSETVVWQNNDRQTHWPVPNCTGLQVKPQATSNGTQIFPPPLLAPVAITYGCAMPGHESERGTINVYADFLVVGSSPQTPLNVYSTPPWVPVAVATGGVSPYKITQDTFTWLQAEEVPPGSSSGISVVVVSAVPSNVVGTIITYQLNATDALGTPATGPISIKIN